MRSVGAALVKLIATATSGLVSFATNVIRPVKVVCEFGPVQEGTGDSSPDNVRPISGWTGCEIGHTGKNLFDGVVTKARIQNGVVVATGSYRLADYIKINPNTTYRLIGNDGEPCQIFAHYFDENKEYLSASNSTEGYVTSPADAEYMRFHVTSITWGSKAPLMLYEGSELTAYEPYQGATLSITFTDPTTGDPLTVYGGSFTLNKDGSADLICRVGAYVITGNETWTKRSDTVYRLQSRNTGVGIYTVGNSKCNYFKTTTGYNPTDGFFSISTGGDMTYVSFCAPSFLGTSTTACQAKAKELYDNGTPIIFCSNLRTPKTYHFPNVGQLKSFLGTNNIWHNMNGDITVEYWNKQ